MDFKTRKLQPFLKSVVVGGNYLTSKIQILMLIIFQIQVTIISLDCQFTDSSSENRDFGYIGKMISHGITIGATREIDYKVIVMGFFLLFETFVVIRNLVTIEASGHANKSAWMKIMNTLGQVHILIFWLPNWIITLDLLFKFYNKEEWAGFGFSCLAAVFNFGLILINLIYRCIALNQNAISMISGEYMFLRVAQGILAAIFKHTTPGAFEVIGLILMMEVLCKISLIYKVPFYKFKCNLLINNLQSISLVLSLIVMLNALVNGTEEVFSYNILFGSLLLCPIVCKVENVIFRKYRANFDRLTNIHVQGNNVVWILHSVIYLKKLLKVGINPNSVANVSEKEFDHAVLITQHPAFKDIKAKNLSIQHLRGFLSSEIKRILIKCPNHYLKLMLAENMIEDIDFLIEPIILLNEILVTKGLPLMFKYTALDMLYEIKVAINQKFETKKTKTLNLQRYFFCTKVEHKFRAMITSAINHSKEIYQSFLEVHPNADKFLDHLQERKKLSIKIDRVWETEAVDYSKQTKIMLIEYGLYHTIVHLNPQKGRKYIRTYIKSYNETLINYHADEINEKTISDPKNAFFLIDGSKEKLGEIITALGNTEHVFGFSSQFLHGKNIEFLMPDCMSGVHNKLISTKLDQSLSKSDHITVDSFAKDSQGFIRKVQIVSTIFPDITQGIKIWGLVRLSKDNSSFILSDPTGKIEGISKFISKDLGIKPDEVTSLTTISSLLDNLVKLVARSDKRKPSSKLALLKGKIGTLGSKILENDVKELENAQMDFEISRMQTEGQLFKLRPINQNAKDLKDLIYHCHFSLSSCDCKKLIVLKFQRMEELEKTVSGSALVSPPSPRKILTILRAQTKTPTKNSFNEVTLNESNEVSLVDIDDHYFLPGTFEETGDIEGEPTKQVQGQKKKGRKASISSLTNSGYEEDVKKLESEQNQQVNYNQSQSSQNSVKSGYTRVRYVDSLPKLNFFAGNDLKIRFLLFAIPFIVFLTSMVSLFIDSTSGIQNVKNYLNVFADVINIDYNIRSIGKNNFWLYIVQIADIIPLMDQTKAELPIYVEGLRGNETIINEYLDKLEHDTLELIFKNDVKIFSGQYDPTTTEFHNGNLFTILDEVISTTLFLVNKFDVTSYKTPIMYTMINKLDANLLNYLVIRTEELKMKLVYDIKTNIDSMTEKSMTQIYISSAVFAFSLLLFVIVAQRGIQKNFYFLNSVLCGKFSEDCKVQINLLNSMQASIDAQDFDKLLELGGAIRDITKKGDKNGNSQFGNRKVFNDRGAKFKILLIFLGGLFLIVSNYLILIAAEKTFLTQVNEVPELIQDVDEAGKLSKKIQLLLMEVFVWMWKRQNYIRNKPVTEAFYEELDSLKADIGLISSKFTYEFQTRMGENVCDYFEDPACKEGMQGILTDGLVAFMNQFVLTLENSIESINSVPFFSFEYFMKAFEVTGLDIYDTADTYAVIRIARLIDQRSSEILDTLDQGSEPVVVFIIIGICLVVAFLLYIISILYPKLLTVRQNICRILLMFPLKSILNSRQLMEILMADSKDFYGILKSSAQNEESYANMMKAKMNIFM